MTRILSIVATAALLTGACAVAADLPSTPPSVAPDTTVVGLPPAIPAADPGLPPDEPVLLGEAYLRTLAAAVLGEGRVRLTAKGDLPSPCHQLRVEVGPPDPDGVIYFELYSVADPEMICVQVLHPFHVATEIDRLGAGAYDVLVAGKRVATFEVTPEQASRDPRPTVVEVQVEEPVSPATTEDD